MSVKIGSLTVSVRPATAGIAVCLCLLVLGAQAWAEVVMPAGKAQTHAMAGGFALLRQPGQTEPYQSSLNPGLFPSFPVWFDTGASGTVISYSIASDLGIPTTGQTYQDEGIGGTETFDVSTPAEVLLVPSLKQPIYGDIAYADQISSYASFGDFNLQLRQADKWLEESLTGYYNIVGTPVLNNYVMRVRPNSLVHQFDLSLLGGPYPMLYMETALLDALPAVLPVGRTIYIPLAYNDYVPASPPITAADNPVIPGVRLADSVSGMLPTPGNDWLFDSGASVSIMSKAVAGQVGITQSTPVVSTAQVGGIGGPILLNGYEVGQIILPSSNETTLTLTDAVIYVVDWDNPADLPAGLPGIFGMNLINKSIDDAQDGLFIDLWGFIHPEYLTDSDFYEWYVDPFGSQLVLVLDGPQPGDVDGDGLVGGGDLSIILANWGLSGQTLPQGDLDADGFVGGSDYSEVLAYWGTGSTPEAIPEPASLALLAPAVIFFACKTRKS